MDLCVRSYGNSVYCYIIQSVLITVVILILDRGEVYSIQLYVINKTNNHHSPQLIFSGYLHQ